MNQFLLLQVGVGGGLYLFQEGRITQEILYVALTMIGCLVGVYIGAVLVR